jgi:endo-1,4-beta-xylanase
MSRWSRRELLQAGLLGATAGAWPAAAFEREPDSLESLARAKGMHFGTSIGGRGLKNPQYAELVRAECGIVVAENALKMPSIQRAPGEFHFEHGERAVAFAEANGQLSRGHCLLWHHPKWVPRWLESYDFGSEPRRSAEKLLLDHITRTATHFGKRISSWDVVNEAVHNITGEMRETRFSEAIGSPDQVLEIAFRAARANLPDTELVYNDYMGWESDNAPHRNGVLRLLERFRKNGVPVNALGIQAHIGAGNQDSNANRSFDARDERAWRKFLEEVVGMGYSLLITELDVHDTPLPADFTARDAQVAALGRGFLDLTLSFTQVSVVVCWGLADHFSWLQGRTPRADGLPKRPTPYDSHLKPKPLRGAIAGALRAAPPRKPESIAGIPA